MTMNYMIFLPACLVQSMLLCGGQVLMKKALGIMEPFAWSVQWWRDLFTNWWWAATGLCFATASMLWMWIVKHYPLSMAYPMVSLSYVFGMLAAIVFFHEVVPMRRWIGVAFIMVGCVLIATPASAQGRKAMTAAQQKEMVARISKAGAQMKTMQCAFVQTKTLSMMNEKIVSRGTMTYAQPARLRWQYMQPTRYLFIIDGDHVSIDSGAGKSHIDARQSKVLQQVIRLMMNGVTGESLSASKDFSVKCYQEGSDDVAVLTPLGKTMRKMFGSVTLYVQRGHDMVRRVVMTEAGGDTTDIILSDVKMNQDVPADTFIMH